MTVTWNPDLIPIVMRAARIGVIAGTEAIRNEMIRSIQDGPKTGRIYTRGLSKSGKSYKVHQASAPGQPPAADSGHLVTTITTRYSFDDPFSMRGWVNTSAEYGKYLEYGTKKMKPRPFARPALAKLSKPIIEDITKRVGEATKQFRGQIK